MQGGEADKKHQQKPRIISPAKENSAVEEGAYRHHEDERQDIDVFHHHGTEPMGES